MIGAEGRKTSGGGQRREERTVNDEVDVMRERERGREKVVQPDPFG